MNDSQRDALLARIDERTDNIVKQIDALPCGEHLERVHTMEMDVGRLKNSETRRKGWSAGLGFLGGAVAWICERLFLRG